MTVAAVDVKTCSRCQPCYAEWQRDRRKDLASRDRDGRYNRAVFRAKQTLSERHPAEYRRLLLAELQREGIA